LYYKLEPLELVYKNIDISYDFEEYKNTTIIKPLLKLQAHDSLGGCNTDTTNDDIVAKLKQVHRRIVSIIDLITYKIIQLEEQHESANTINIINQAPFEHKLIKTMTIYSKNSEMNIENDFIKIITLESKSIGFNEDVYELKVLLITKKIRAFSRSIANLDDIEQKKWNLSTGEKIVLNDKYIIINSGKIIKKIFF
ncbi:alpha-mannosidase, partial [Mycoplasma marinum]